MGGLLVLTAVFFFASPASADLYVDVPPPQVGPTAGAPVVVPQRPVAVTPVRQARVARGLALTGADVLGLVGLAAGAVAVGAVTVRVGRRVPSQ